MRDYPILSEKPEDNQRAAEWAMNQAELIRRGDEATRRINDKYKPIMLARLSESNNGKSHPA